MRLFFEPADERPRPRQSHLKVVNPKEQEEAVARLGMVGTYQCGMLVRTPCMQTQQDRSIGVDDLPKIVVRRSRLRQAKQRLVPPEALRYVHYADDGPRALHGLLCKPNTAPRAMFNRVARTAQLPMSPHRAEGEMTIRFVFAVLLSLGLPTVAARAEDCRAYPPGPMRFACASRTHPGLIEKQERCQEEGRRMGLKPAGGLQGAGGGLKEYVQACMQRR